MKRKSLLQKTWVVLALINFMCISHANGQFTLKHSYPFNDGTATDVVGGADGTVIGGTIADTVYTTSANGDIIELPAATIAINTYSAITFEVYVVNSVSAPTNAMLYYFGGSLSDLGVYGTFLTPKHWRSGTLAGISTARETNPWEVESYVIKGDNPITSEGQHHLVVIIDDVNITLYVDGVHNGTTDLATMGNSIAALSNDFAWIGRGGYTSDQTWLGILDEFNIYEGSMDIGTIVQHASDYLGIDIINAKLESIATNAGELDPVFDPETEFYELYLPYGSTSVKLEAVPQIEGVTVEMYDGLGTEIVDGNVTFGDVGIDVEIIATSLNGANDQSYYISILLKPGTESSTLSEIQLSEGRMLEEFDFDSLEYTVIVPYGLASVDVTGVPTWPSATVEGDGTIDMSSGTATTKITVTSEDGLYSKEYTVNLYSSVLTTGQDFFIQQEASGLVIGESEEAYNVIKLGYPERDDSTKIFQLVESGVAGQYFLQNHKSGYITLSTTNTSDMLITDTLTQNLDSCRYTITEFEPGRFKIQSVAKTVDEFLGSDFAKLDEQVLCDKVEGDQTIIWNIRTTLDVLSPYDTYLTDLSLSTGNLIPAFNSHVSDYHIVFPEGTTSITVGATPKDDSVTITGSGIVDVSDGDGIFTITVTAKDTNYFTDYNIYYKVNTALTLMHSYTFADGTAKDVVGDADGTVMGGEFSEGSFITSMESDYIELPGDEIAINTYPSFTLESYTVDLATSNGGNAMLSYFGKTVGTYGNDYIFTSLKARAAVSCLNETSPWGTESGVSSTSLMDDALPHHLVSVVNNDSIIFYIDGVIVGTAKMSDDNKIFNISNTLAYICKSGYTGDPTWNGQFLEYNIYSGEMDAVTVTNRYLNFPIEDSTYNSTLSDLQVNGVSIDNFVSSTLTYNIKLPFGTDTVPAVTAIPSVSSAVVEITDASDVPGTTTILVTSENSTTSNTYTINFSLAASAEARLSDLTVNGTTVADFDPDIYSYIYEVAIGTSLVPVVEATPVNPEAGVNIEPALIIPGVTKITVTATDNSEQVYNVYFKFSSNSIFTQEGITINVYPTISNGSFTVETPNRVSLISVYNYSGKLMHQQTGTSPVQTIDLSNAGMYIVKVDCEGVTKMFKVFKTNN